MKGNARTRLARFASRVAPALVFFAFTGAENAFAAVKCQLRVGAGCGGPVVYEIQLCARVTFQQGVCVNLCQGLRPICQVSDYDQWVQAYDRKGRNGYHGELAETSKPDAYDQTGQLAATAGNTYTVCMREAGPIGAYSDPVPASASGACPGMKIATADSCGAGTVFNGNPGDPKCVTRDSYCNGGGSTGNFVSTMNAGFQMVAVQNEHFVNAPGQDTNLQQNAVVAGTEMPGLTAPVKAASSAGVSPAPFTASTSPSRGSAVTVAPGTSGGSAPSASASGGGTNTLRAQGEMSALASKTFATDPSAYAAVTGGAVRNGGAGEANGFANSGDSAVAGGSSGDVGFEGSAGTRGVSADGRLIVDDPANYFLMSDVAVSLFKRVSAQCRKKERSLVLAPSAN